MPQRRLLAAVMLAVLAAASVLHLRCTGWHRQRRPGQAHNPLELWNVAGVREELGAGLPGAPGTPSIRCNATLLRGSHEWVEVTWSGLPAGAGAGLAPREFH